MKIKIIAGNYGCSVGGVIKVKTPSDPPFDVDEREAQRLVNLKVAEIVGAGEISPAKGSAPLSEESAEPAGDGGKLIPDSENPSGESGGEIPDYSDESTNDELQAIAKKYGIDIPKRANKAQIISALDNFFAGAADEGEE